MKLYYNINNPNDVRDLESQMQIWLDSGNPKVNEWKLQPTRPSDDSTWTNGEWIVLPPPTYTAGQWLEMVGYGADQKPTLLYLKLQLQSVGKSSEKLNSVETYLNQVLEIFASDPTPKSDWANPPYSYRETVLECLKKLKE